MDHRGLRRRRVDPPDVQALPDGLHHWGFTVEPDDKADIYAKMQKYGVTPYSPYVDAPDVNRPFAEDAVKDPDGNRFDVSTGMRPVRPESPPAEKKEAVSEVKGAPVERTDGLLPRSARFRPEDLVSGAGVRVKNSTWEEP
jgi:hypothetical protein